MAKSDSIKSVRSRLFGAKGVVASQLRRRRCVLKQRFGVPDDLLGGSLVLRHRRCGKPSCWCAEQDGHPQWTLTHSVNGAKQIESIPAEMVDLLMPLVEKGQAHRDAVNEVRSINAQLLRLWRSEQRERMTAKAGHKTKPRPRRRKK